MTLEEFKQHPTWRRISCKPSIPYKGMIPSTVCVRTGIFKLEPFSGATSLTISFIRRAPDAPPKLAQISIITEIGNAAETGNALVEKFGFRPNVTSSVAANAFGTPLKTATATWMNDSGSEVVVLKAPCGRIDQMCLEYSDVPLIVVRTQEIQQAMRAQAKRY